MNIPMKQLLAIYFFFIYIINCQAQDPDMQGSSCLDELQFKKARAIFQHRLKNNPDDADALIGLARSCLALNNKDSAKINLQKALLLNSKNPFALAGLGEISLLNNDRNGEEAYFDRARRADKMNPEVSYTIAKGCMNPVKPDTAKAWIYLKPALDLHPKNARLHLLNGDLEVMKKNYGAAFNAYDRAIFFDPKSAIAYRTIGYLYFRSKSYKDAMHAFNKSIAINSDQVLVYKYLGDLLYSTARYPESEQAYLTYMERADVTQEDKEKFAIILFFNKKNNEASALLERVTSISHQESVLLRIRGYIAYETGDYQKGKEYLNRFFQLHPPQKIMASDYIYYAKIMQKLGNDSLAMDNYIKSISLDSSNSDTYEELAKLAAKNNMHQVAAGYYKKMIEHGADKIVNTFLIGKEYYFEGEIWRMRLDSMMNHQKSGGMSESGSSPFRKSMTYYYSRSDSAFSIVNQLNAAYAGSFIWRGRIHAILDPEATTTIAKEMYEKALSLLEKTEPSKNKKSIVECYKYLGSYYYLGFERFYRTDKKMASEMRSKSLQCFAKIIVLDPEDEQAKEVIKKLEYPAAKSK